MFYNKLNAIFKGSLGGRGKIPTGSDLVLGEQIYNLKGITIHLNRIKMLKSILNWKFIHFIHFSHFYHNRAVFLKAYIVKLNKLLQRSSSAKKIIQKIKKSYRITFKIRIKLFFY